MIRLRKSGERGYAEHGWLHSRHTFSFAQYLDPQHMGYSVLRVLNEDLVEAGKGFATHPHRDMEIISYVISGALEHRDSMGNGSVIRPGEVQRMSAGTGVTHSEFNASDVEPVRFLQIWIMPDRSGYAPGYEQVAYASPAGWGELASPEGGTHMVSIHQDARMLRAMLEQGDLPYHISPGRCCYVHLVGGQVCLNGEPMHGGDGAYVSDETTLLFSGASDAEILLFDLPTGGKHESDST